MADPVGIGEGDDIVKLVLGGDELKITESYEIKTSVLTQPAGFSLRLGWGDVVKDLLTKYPPNTEFKLFIGDVQYQQGRTDGFEASDGTGGTELTIFGRDALAPLHDAFVQTEKSFTNATYVQIVETALKAVGLETSTLVFTNDANRKAITNGKASAIQPARNVQEIELEGPSPIRKTVYANMGERWYEFVKRHLDRAGLFLWCGGQGEFVLTEPNAKQNATYRIVRRRGQTRNEVNVISASYRNDTTDRHTEAVVYGRGGGKKFGRSKSKGSFVDDEMSAYGFNKTLVFRDTNCNTLRQAEFFARRKLAEARRRGWHLTYTLAGHSAPTPQGGQAIWAPDTVVEVIDDEYNLNGKYYVESVRFNRPPTTTTVVLMRPEDLVFGTDEF